MVNKDKKQKRREYYIKNRDKILAENKQWRIDNHDKVLENDKKRYIRDREKHLLLTKKYYENNKVKCNAVKQKWAENNRKSTRASASKYKSRIRQERLEYIDNYKLQHPCIKCGESRIHCLDFHHTKNKINSVHYMAQTGKSEELIQQEILKCDIYCSNCHRKNHFKNYDNLKWITPNSKKGFILYMKLRSKCYLCNECHPACLDFHHINTETKIETISNMAWKKGYTLDEIKIEIEKCIILCTNCHRLYHKQILILPQDIQCIKIE